MIDPSTPRALPTAASAGEPPLSDMVRDHINQDLRCRADSLPLFHGLIDQWLGFNVQAVRLFDDRSCLIEKIDQRSGRWQRFLNLLKLWVAEAGHVADEFNEPVFQHCLTLLGGATAVNTFILTNPSEGMGFGRYPGSLIGITKRSPQSVFPGRGLSAPARRWLAARVKPSAITRSAAGSRGLFCSLAKRSNSSSTNSCSCGVMRLSLAFTSAAYVGYRVG